MIVLDTSAAIAALLGEPEAERVHDVLTQSTSIVVGAPTRVELGLVANGRAGGNGTLDVDAWLRAAGVGVVEFSPDHATVAIDAFIRYGKGRHRAGLNYGDCMSYAVAKVADAALLYVGDDFVHTDIESAISRG